MTKYHINNEGVPGICHAGEGANPRGCDFGNESQHYASKDAAREAYELSNEKREKKELQLKKDFFKTADFTEGEEYVKKYKPLYRNTYSVLQKLNADTKVPKNPFRRAEKLVEKYDTYVNSRPDEERKKIWSELSIDLALQVTLPATNSVVMEIEKDLSEQDWMTRKSYDDVKRNLIAYSKIISAYNKEDLNNAEAETIAEEELRKAGWDFDSDQETKDILRKTFLKAHKKAISYGEEYKNEQVALGISESK